jgi:hypothetical protein
VEASPAVLKPVVAVIRKATSVVRPSEILPEISPSPVRIEPGFLLQRVDIRWSESVRPIHRVAEPLLLLFSHLLGGQVDVGLDQELGQQDRFLCASHRYLLIDIYVNTLL